MSIKAKNILWKVLVAIVSLGNLFLALEVCFGNFMPSSIACAVNYFALAVIFGDMFFLKIEEK